MSKRKRYTDDERAMYVAMLDAEGYPDRLGALKKVADFGGVHTNVLRRWWRKTQNPPPTKLVTQKRQTIEDRLEEVIHSILDVLLDDGIEEASPQALFTGLGISIDKRQLMQEKPTERIAHDVTSSDTERSARIAALLEAARDRRDRSTTDERTDTVH